MIKLHKVPENERKMMNIVVNNSRFWYLSRFYNIKNNKPYIKPGILSVNDQVISFTAKIDDQSLGIEFRRPITAIGQSQIEIGKPTGNGRKNTLRFSINNQGFSITELTKVSLPVV